MNSSERPAPPPCDPLLREEEGRVEFLLGNEAIVRGALEAGVAYATGYPGTPSSEVTDAFARLAASRGIAFEYAVNEKIAIETAFGASLAGARSIVAMKHLGLMYAGDPISTIPYVGTVGGMVIVSAGDPSCRTSPNEQDQRRLADMLHVPMLDPSTPQEALEMTRFAFEWSERSRLPVVIRPVTWVCHTRAPVGVGRLAPPAVKGFVRDPSRFVPIPVNAKRLRSEIDGRLRTARRMLAESGFLRRSGSGPIAVVTSGAPAAVVEDLLDEEGLRDRVSLVVLGGTFPLPDEWIAHALSEFQRVLVVEELSPYLEDALRVIASVHRIAVEILGKRTDHLPTAFELDPSSIRSALWSALGTGRKRISLGSDPKLTPSAGPVPPRPPILCASCPHRSAFYAARAVFGPDTIYLNDIGCYTLGFGPPLETADALLCMGAGITLAAGVARATGRRTVGFVGDSTFFHSGMPGLLDAAKEGVGMVVVVMDNEVTAMTGWQESPTVTVEDGGVRRAVDIEGVVRALGVPQVETVDPHDLAATMAAFVRARDAKGLAVVVTKHPCPVWFRKATGTEEPAPAPPQGDHPARKPETYVVLADRCATCGREAIGHRCDLPPDACYDLAISRSRAVHGGDGPAHPRVAPCAEACPLYLCVQGYAAHVAAGRYAEALRLVMARLPLPDSVCRVCHRPCEPACVRNGVDEAVAVNDVKRFVVEWADRQTEFPYRPEREPDHGKHVAVVGAGPSGLAAAHELRLRGYEVTLFDANDEPGGLLSTGIPRYRLPPEALRRDVKRVLDTGVRFVPRTRLGKDVSLAGLLAQHDAVYLATGAPRGRALPLAGAGPSVVDALRFLRWAREAGSGTGRRVVVIGGGDSAIDASRTALRTGASHARVVCLEGRDDMPALRSQVMGAVEEGVEVLPRARAVRLVPEGVDVIDVAPKREGAKDPADFADVPGTERVLAADQVVVAIGQDPDAGLLCGSDPALHSRDGRFVVDEDTGRTSHPRVFAGGDATDGVRSVTDAIARGLRAAWGIDRSLRGIAAADKRMPPPIPLPGRPHRGAHPSRRAPVPRVRPEELDPKERTRSFDEVVLPFTEEQARAEAERCMVCGLCGNCRSCIDVFGCPAFSKDGGRVTIDEAQCVACGVCALFCPNEAIVPSPLPEARNAGGIASGERA